MDDTVDYLHMDLSVITVCHNNAEVIIPCLTSVLYNNECDSEIFVVDNASIDGSVEAIQNQFPQVSIITNNTNRGFGAANNQAIRKCHGRYIFFLNPDTILTKGSLIRAISFMDTHPDVGLAGTRIINPDGSLQESISYRYPGEKYARHCLHNLKGKIACVLGASMIAQAKLIQSIGGFDENFFLYGEEQDLALRVRRAGQEIGYIDEAIVIHLRAHSERFTPLAEIWEKKVRAEYLFYWKHYDRKAIQRIIRANLTKAIWRILSLRLEMYLFPIKQTCRDKLIKYETVYRITRDIYQKQYTKRLNV